MVEPSTKSNNILSKEFFVRGEWEKGKIFRFGRGMDFKILLRLLVLLPSSSWACISVVKKTKADAVTTNSYCVRYCELMF